MSAKRFVSKIDGWLVLVLTATLIAQTGVLISVVWHNESMQTIAIVTLVTVVVFLLIGMMLARTYYEVDPNHLRIACGPFQWKIPLDQIHSVEPSRSVLSSPALSLDRLRIRYGKRKSILVSPADKPRFMKALGFDPASAGSQ